MILTEFTGGCFTVQFYGDDAALLARACTTAGQSTGGDDALAYHTMATLFTLGALASQLYGQTPGGEHENTTAANLLARIHGGEEESEAERAAD